MGDDAVMFGTPPTPEVERRMGDARWAGAVGALLWLARRPSVLDLWAKGSDAERRCVLHDLSAWIRGAPPGEEPCRDCAR